MKRKITFNETPRPQFVRDNYTCLDGTWDFAFDDENEGEILGYQNGFAKQYDIIVPFAYETEASGINIHDRCDNVWYQRKITLDKREGKRYLLHLEGSDYLTKVFVNGKYVGRDEGAYHRQTYDLTEFVNKGENLLVIKCEDDYAVDKPRGKQRWKDDNFECFYIDTTGIYKTVWMEEVSSTYIESVKITPNFDKKNVTFEFNVKYAKKNTVKAIVSYNGEVIATKASKVKDETVIKLSLGKELHPWDVNNPDLYDVKFVLLDKEEVIDEVDSYFGVRKIQAKRGYIYLNNKPLYQKLVLDQGYYIKGQLTQVSNKEMYDDIVLMQQAGFNGCRKHEKVEDERFIYYCDMLGYLMWSEMPSMYFNDAHGRKVFEREWMKTMPQQYNHPSIITWTVFNESWGIPDVKTNKVQQDFAVHMYNITKAYDPYRFCQVNDGWEHTVSDIASIHHYEQDPEKFIKYFNTKKKCLLEKWKAHHKGMMADGFEYKGQPIMITEFGGTAYEGATKGSKNWGYGQAVKNDEEFIKRFSGLIRAINSYKHCCGYCYTQVTDVQQEVNGVLYADRKPKVDLKTLKAVLDERNK